MKKKLTLVVTCVVLVAAMVIGGTLAYFTDTKTAENTFTVGNVEIKLEEPNWKGSGEADAPEVYPGEPLAKDPTVTNTGANPCFVRIKVTGLDSLKSLSEADAEKGLTDMIQYRNEKYALGELNEGWEKNGDYFYYTGVLEAGATTKKPVFSSIVIPNGLNTGDAKETKTEYNVIVTAEAVQAQGAKEKFTDVQKMTVPEIAAWFATCMPSTPAGE